MYTYIHLYTFYITHLILIVNINNILEFSPVVINHVQLIFGRTNGQVRSAALCIYKRIRIS